MPQKPSPEQANAVWEKIAATAENDPRFNELREHVSAIAYELAGQDAFDQVDGSWVLSERAWNDWIFGGGYERYSQK